MQKQKDRKINNEQREHKGFLFAIELIFAVAFAVGCSIAGMSNLLWESNQLYPASTDLLGHMTKVIYIAGQLVKGHIPSWFPYWYNGSATTQYDAPLSYYLMAPIYLVTNNIMLTFKIFGASVMAAGGFGVWVVCYKKIGRFCGLVGIIAYCFQPILLSSLYREGVIAQGPIYAIAPWLLLAVLSCSKKPSRGKYAATTILITLLILSHVMQALIICFAVELTLLLFVIIRKITIRNFAITTSGIVLGGLLTAFWSVVGAFGFENPGIPLLLTKSAEYTTADINWFLPGSNAFFHYSITITALSIVGILCFLCTSLLKKNTENQSFYGLAGIILTVITTVFSFGSQIPGFRYLPYASRLVPGWILTFTAVTGAILSAYVIYSLWRIPRVKFIIRLFSLVLIGLICIDMNPYKVWYQTLSSNDFDKMTTLAQNQNSNFDKGRYHWIGNLNNSEILFSYLKNYNISGGENIEGTLHNQTIDNSYMALPLMKYDYLIKQTALWNVRYLLFSNEYSGFGTQLRDQLGFENAPDAREGFQLYISNRPSSYYLTDPRNALVVSSKVQGFSIQFPNFVQGQSKNLWDYSEKELQQYKLIYIIEPVIKTMTQKTEFESMVTRLVNAGVKVMIEPTASKTFDLFDVHVEDEICETSPVFQVTSDCPYNLSNYNMVNNSNLGTIRSLFGIDQVYAEFNLKNGSIKDPVLGTKKTGNGEVIFVGAHLSQYLDTVYSRNNGMSAVNSTVEHNSHFIQSVYSTIFTDYGVNKNYLPEAFETVKEQNWDDQGGNFTYESSVAKQVTVSVTYTPRWNVTVDGKKIKVGQRENLITLKLPAGTHKVVLRYGITVYGKIGYLISAAVLFLFLLIILLWRWNMKLVQKSSNALRNYYQLDDEPQMAMMPETIILNQSKELLEEAAAARENTEEGKEEVVLTDLVELNTDRKQLQNQPEDKSDLYISRRTVNENGIMIEIIDTDHDEKVADENNHKPEDKKKEQTGSSKTDQTHDRINKGSIKRNQMNEYTKKPVQKSSVITRKHNVKTAKAFVPDKRIHSVIKNLMENSGREIADQKKSLKIKLSAERKKRMLQGKSSNKRNSQRNNISTDMGRNKRSTSTSNKRRYIAIHATNKSKNKEV